MARVPGLWGRLWKRLNPAGVFLSGMLLVVVYFIAATDGDWFNPSQVLELSPHHEQLALVLGGLAFAVPWVRTKHLRILYEVVSLLVLLWFVSMTVSHP